LFSSGSIRDRPILPRCPFDRNPAGNDLVLPGGTCRLDKWSPGLLVLFARQQFPTASQVLMGRVVHTRASNFPERLVKKNGAQAWPKS
jgi:hypothetical protein